MLPSSLPREGRASSEREKYRVVALVIQPVLTPKPEATNERTEMVDAVAESDDALLRLLKAAKGIRVRPTPKALEQGIAKATDVGTVTGWGEHRWSVVVRKDGQITSRGYHVSFWRPIKPRRRSGKGVGR